MRKFAVLLYPDFSLQEITCLTSALTIWFGEKIDFIASEKKEYVSEEGLCVLPTRTTAEARIISILRDSAGDSQPAACAVR